MIGFLLSYVDNLFFFNIRELLKILVVLLIGSIEVERLFFCVRRIYMWLRSRMIIDRLLDLVVIVMYCYSIYIDWDKVYNKYMVIYLRCMMLVFLFYD